MANIKDLSKLPEQLAPGHRLCGGCGASIAVRQVLMGAGDTHDLVLGSATGCLEVSTTVYPYTSWKTPFIHNAFENAAATMSGVESAYKAMKRAGKIDADRDIKFVTFGGDGGTYDIGMQSLSGAMERGHDMVYVCYNNEAYMNTGIQRSGATPYAAWATTSEVGSAKQGKEEFSKDMTSIIADHHIPYVAQASISDWKDLTAKAEKAIMTPGPAFLNILAPCPRGWRMDPALTVEVARRAVACNIWPSFEVENGVWKLDEPKKKCTIEEYMKPQGRYKHVFKPGNEGILPAIQKHVDDNMNYLRGRVLGSQYLVD